MNINDVVGQVSKLELADVANEIKLKFDPSASAKDLAKKVCERLNEIARDDSVDIELSELAYEVAITAEIITPDGDLINESEVKVELKACFGFADDDADPSCKKCRLLADCKIERIRIRPKCFGTSKRDEHDPECRVCLEYHECLKNQK